MKGLPPLPSVPPPFPAAFRTVLHGVLAAGPRLVGGRVELARARAAVLSQSGTFVGHRPYGRGDDLRRIDWAAYARSGELFVKLLEEEERRVATLLLDLSPRQLAGTPPRRLGALRLAAVLGGLALRHLDGLTVLAPGAAGRARESFSGAGDLDRLLGHLESLPVVDVGPRDLLEPVLARGVGGRLHWIADFADPAACEALLAAVRRRGGKVFGWLPSLPEDRRAPQRGYLRVADPATGESTVVVVDAALADELQRELEALQRRQDRLFASCGSTLHRWPVPGPDEIAPGPYLEVVARCSR